jgi:lipid-binding SYLF domain-containing protein
MRFGATKFGTAALLLAAIVGCQTAPQTQDERAMLQDDADATLKHMYRVTSIKPFIDNSAGYVVFPSVGKGGLIVGGGYGRGIVYEGGNAVGYADLTKLSVGATIGAQTYTEVLVFQTRQGLEDFKGGKFKFSADATAVAIKEGVAAKYVNGVAVFVDSKGGLEADASIGGQEFSYKPM